MYAYVYMYVCMHVCMHVCMYVCMYIHMCVFVYVHSYVCMYDIHTYMHACVHTVVWEKFTIGYFYVKIVNGIIFSCLGLSDENFLTTIINFLGQTFCSVAHELGLEGLVHTK